MLTDSEREWLNNRDNHAEHFCRWCDTWETCLGEFGAIFCPSWTQKVQLREAAEFEARVAALLAEIMPKALADPWFIKNAKHINADATLKWARLSVEEEIDADI